MCDNISLYCSMMPGNGSDPVPAPIDVSPEPTPGLGGSSLFSDDDDENDEVGKCRKWSYQICVCFGIMRVLNGMID